VEGKGLKAIIYLDDGIVSVKGEHQAIEASTQVKRDLDNAGFVINIEKSSWVSSQTGKENQRNGGNGGTAKITLWTA